MSLPLPEPADSDLTKEELADAIPTKGRTLFEALREHWPESGQVKRFEHRLKDGVHYCRATFEDGSSRLFHLEGTVE